MKVYVVVLEHEHGTDIQAFLKEKDAEYAVLEICADTKEIASAVEDDQDGKDALKRLIRLVADDKVKEAVNMYNAIYYTWFNGDEMHRLFVREVKIK